GEWSLFYQNIDGFEYKAGTEYTLKVNVTDIPNPESANTTSSTGTTKTLLVDPQLYDCVGVAPMKCMKVKELPSGEWSLFYQNIDGFEYKAGTEYTLKVNVTDIPNP
ncbi:DUF4377 domain-containing protein, partial [Shigella sp. FC1967]|uniref:DUF4377 domain-containing protein n=1 Tax=Shigella sp. FC1967 TaxID=1898041 RepID=UPI000AF8052A